MWCRLAAVLAATGFIASVAAVPADAQQGYSSQVGFVDVNVATVWTDSSKPRDVDAPALTNPTDIDKWLSSMTVAQYLDLTNSDRTQTQAVYGNRVYILNETDTWYEVAVEGQPTPKNTLGYPGWIPKVQIALDEKRFGNLLKNKALAQVHEATAAFYSDAGLSKKMMDIPYATRLPIMHESRDAFKVAMPSGDSGYLAKKSATRYRSVAAIPYPSQDDLVQTAKLFVNRPYLWGGTSGYAFDCSGFTHTIYEGHGITIPRDADAQADFTGHGTSVSRNDLQPGDLLYYAHNLSDAGSIHHVAMYVGNNQMAEAYGAGIPVRITAARFNATEYWGAQRFLKEKK